MCRDVLPGFTLRFRTGFCGTSSPEWRRGGVAGTSSHRDDFIVCFIVCFVLLCVVLLRVMTCSCADSPLRWNPVALITVTLRYIISSL